MLADVYNTVKNKLRRSYFAFPLRWHFQVPRQFRRGLANDLQTFLLRHVMGHIYIGKSHSAFGYLTITYWFCSTKGLIALFWEKGIQYWCWTLLLTTNQKSTVKRATSFFPPKSGSYFFNKWVIINAYALMKVAPLQMTLTTAKDCFDLPTYHV